MEAFHSSSSLALLTARLLPLSAADAGGPRRSLLLEARIGKPTLGRDGSVRGGARTSRGSDALERPKKGSAGRRDDVELPPVEPDGESNRSSSSSSSTRCRPPSEAAPETDVDGSDGLRSRRARLTKRRARSVGDKAEVEACEEDEADDDDDDDEG
jgi:hypothetical protein